MQPKNERQGMKVAQGDERRNENESLKISSHAKDDIRSRYKMMYSNYVKQRIIFYHNQDVRPPMIAKALRKEGIVALCVGVYKLLLKYLETGTVARRTGSGRPPKATEAIENIVEEQMLKDDETTANQLWKVLADRGYELLLVTILRNQRTL